MKVKVLVTQEDIYVGTLDFHQGTFTEGRRRLLFLENSDRIKIDLIINEII